MRLELELDVPENRQVSLPSEVPVGKVRVSVAVPGPAGGAAPVPHTSAKFQRERAAYFRLLPELLKTHLGKVVAIHDEKVIAVGEERRPVIDEATRIAGVVDMFVHCVEEVEPVERIPGFREVRGWRSEDVSVG